MTLKEQIEKDFDVFFNLNEFAEIHLIDGRPMPVVIDNDRLRARTEKEFNGISIGEILLFVRKEDFGDRPGEGQPVRFKKRQMYVADYKEDAGMYEIILTQNRS